MIKSDITHQPSAPINASVGHPHTGWLPVPTVLHQFNYSDDGDHSLEPADVGMLKSEPRPERVVLFGARGMMGPAAVEALAGSGVKHLLVTDVPIGSGKLDARQEERRAAEAL